MRLEMVSNSCLECEVLLDAICPFNMNSIIMELITRVDLKKRNGHRCEKTGEKQNELSFLMKHFQIGTKR
jgi:hypothetical protein